MPQYRNKKRLERIIASGKEWNSLTRHLILAGKSCEEASQGLESYVSDWEQSVKYIQQSSVNDIGYSEEYDHDLWARTELYRVSQYASEEEMGRYRQRIEQADSAFKNATVDSTFAKDHLKNPDKELHWWLFRDSKKWLGFKRQSETEFAFEKGKQRQRREIVKIKRKIIEIDEEKCTGCGKCVLACAEGAIQIINGKAKVMSDNLCDGLGACIGDCPEDALHIIEREAEEFDEKAVEEHLQPPAGQTQLVSIAPRCPSARVDSFAAPDPCQIANQPAAMLSPASALTHWPVQIHLVPPTAPFLMGADLLVAADCVAVAYPRLQTELLPGRVIMIGCPKFDDRNAYADKFSQIFKITGIKSITCVMMEVPCCFGLPVILKEAMRLSKTDIPMEVITVSTRGEILDRKKMH